MTKTTNNDMPIVCLECGLVFILTSDESDWYRERNYNLPKRCPRCRRKRRAAERLGNAEAKGNSTSSDDSTTLNQGSVFNG